MYNINITSSNLRDVDKILIFLKMGPIHFITTSVSRQVHAYEPSGILHKTIFEKFRIFTNSPNIIP